MGWLEGINRRSARPKPLTSLPGADRACWSFFWPDQGLSSEIMSDFRTAKFYKIMKNDFLIFSNMWLIVCS